MRVPVTGLVGQPGETRPFAESVDRDEFGDAGWGPAEGAIDGPIELDLHLDAVVEGILARGTIGFRLELPCSRCLEPQVVAKQVPVAELFQDPRKREEGDEDDPGYELVDDLTAIELDTLVRDTVLVDLPVRILCRPDCRGLCSTCGANLNEIDCGHRQRPGPDPRWAKLAELDLTGDDDLSTN